MIKVEDVHFTYPTGVETIRGVTIRMEDGEFVAIMGENGAGKTTLVKHFNGLLKPTRGYVEVDGIDTRNASVAELSRKVGLVFQNSDHQLFSETVEEEIAFGLRNFGFDAQTISKRVEWALNLLDLVEYRKSSPFMLSGGERKRLALASVLAWDPQIIVLDEPTIGQDYQQKEKLREFIAQLIAQKRTVIVVTHDVEFVAECCPRVILMSRGEVVADGPAARILTDYETVTRVSLLPPQVTQILLRLSDLGLPSNIINIYDARRLLSERILKAGLR